MAETPVDTPALPGDGLRESIVDDLRRHIGDGLVEFLLKPQDDLWIRVSAESWEAAGRALRAMGFEYFCFLSAIDWKPSPFGRGEDDPTEPPPERTDPKKEGELKQGYAGGVTRFQVFARVTDIRRHVGVTLKVDIDDDTMTLDSWHALYAGANWHERETHEMYGVVFVGHPDLRNMYLPTEFEGFPLRKDFPLLARMVKPWPGIVDVEPMPVEDGEGEPGVVGADTARGADSTVGADASGADADVSAENDAEGVSVAVGSTESVSGNVPESGRSADANLAPEPVAPPSAEEVEAAAEAAADDARAEDEDAAADDAAVLAADPADVEAVTIEPGAAPAEAPVDPSSTEDAGPESEAAEHPESSAVPADATDETIADAPDHSQLEPAGAADSARASAPDRSADDTEAGVASASEQPDAEPEAEQ